MGSYIRRVGLIVLTMCGALACTGPAGKQGAQGEPGENGRTGPKGDQGEPGPAAVDAGLTNQPSTSPGPAAQPGSAPEGVTSTNGYAVALSTTRENEPGVVQGNAEVKLNAHLESGDGQRAVQVTTMDGDVLATVAERGWNILPVAAEMKGGKLLVCWNQLLGVSVDGAIPDPAAGVALVCRYGDSSHLGETFQAAHDSAPTWLMDLVPNADGTVRIRYLRTASGWILGAGSPGDGVFERTFDGTGIGDSVNVMAAM